MFGRRRASGRAPGGSAAHRPAAPAGSPARRAPPCRAACRTRPRTRMNVSRGSARSRITIVRGSVFLGLLARLAARRRPCCFAAASVAVRRPGNSRSAAFFWPSLRWSAADRRARRAWSSGIGREQRCRRAGRREPEAAERVLRAASGIAGGIVSGVRRRSSGWTSGLEERGVRLAELRRHGPAGVVLAVERVGRRASRPCSKSALHRRQLDRLAVAAATLNSREHEVAVVGPARPLIDERRRRAALRAGSR